MWRRVGVIAKEGLGWARTHAPGHANDWPLDDAIPLLPVDGSPVRTMDLSSYSQREAGAA